MDGVSRSFAILLLAAGAEPRLLRIGGFHVGRGTDLHLAEPAVHDDGVAGLDQVRDVGDVTHRRDAERPRHDGHMAADAAILEHEAAQLGAIVFEQRRRPHSPGHDHRVLGQLVVRGHERLACQLVQQPVGELV